MEISQQIAEKLLQINAIKLNTQNPFTWASGIKSPIYCDNRITLSYPDVRGLIIKSFAEKSKIFTDIDVIAGVATAGIAHGALLADYLNLPFIYIRSEAKSHGRQNQIEGEIREGQNALVIEDLISTGGSSIKASNVLLENKVNVLGVMAIFDYQFDLASENFDKANIPYLTLSNYSALLELALDANYISTEEKKVLETWNQDPKSWFDNIK